ncbi:uncharacterized protein LOC127266421 isoform X2 [Andrographis paniculata]|uniref:uncharacterized protein LOC127266421 isoform X2 n=1 Tax=Andrographis paniculata TaxID=175694 RepID=UPI0021E9A3C6|nr:uncharacterized protein LOC127266421 isoform X2 [Andrographis paniculata]
MAAVEMHAYFSNAFLKIVPIQTQFAGVSIPCQYFSRGYFSAETSYRARQYLQRSSNKAIEAVVPGVNDDEILSSSSPSFSIDDFTVTATSSADKDDQLKIAVEVSGSKTQEIYDVVFSKMVDDAQPIPGFRRVKGGKTPNIPKHILLEILGPSNVFEQVIRKVINTAISEYVAKV